MQQLKMKRSVFDRNFNIAKEKLIEVGLVSRDGSGEPHIEELLAHTRLLADGMVLLEPEDEE